MFLKNHKWPIIILLLGIIGCKEPNIIYVGQVKPPIVTLTNVREDTIYCDQPCRQPEFTDTIGCIKDTVIFDTAIFDTAKVIMLVSDTCCPIGIRMSVAYTRYGYEVYTHDYIGKIHVCYLDIDKKRLNEFVWISNQIP
jgi:hypothetical protein